MSRVLRLFGIRKASSKQQIEGLHFSDQGIAKKKRDILTANTGEQHVLCPGPDHKRYNQWLVEIERQAESEVS
jgi:hypothetical protein